MEGETIKPSPSESKVDQAERTASLERERRFLEAYNLIDIVQSETARIIHRDEILLVLSNAGIKTISEDLDNNIKDGDTGAKEVVKPSLDNITKIEENIKELNKLGAKFGHDQGAQVYQLTEIILQIKVSQDEAEIKNLIAQAKNIFNNNVTGLINGHSKIASQQERLGELTTKNGKQLQTSLVDNFDWQDQKQIEQGPVGFYIKRSLDYGKTTATLVKNSLSADNQYRLTLESVAGRFSQVMDSLVADKNDNNQAEIY
jgi:hypothetical protein